MTYYYLLLSLIIETLKQGIMKTFELTFSLRDWRKGSELLLRLGLTEKELLTESHTLQVDDDMKELLLDELNELDLEFDLEELA